MIEQTTKHAADDGFFAQLAQDAKTADGPLPDDVQSRLDAGAAAARWRTPDWPDPCVRTAAVAPDRDAVGRERYALASRAFLGATVDLEETLAWACRNSTA